jgi:hypothetical protein
MKCPQCSTEYDLGLNFCKKCEVILEAVELEEPIPSSHEGISDKSILEGKEIIIQDKDIPDKEVVKKKEEVKEIREEIERSLVKAVIKELLLIKDERERYNKLLQGLEEKKGRMSEDVYNETKTNYENNLMEIAKRFKELKATYTGLKEKVTEEIQSSEKELSILKEDLSTLKRMTKTESTLIQGKKDLRTEERRLSREIKTIEKNLKEKRWLQDVLSLKEKPDGFNRRTIAFIAIGILLVVAAIYGITTILYREPGIKPSEMVSPLKEEIDLKGVKELLEKIKRANLEKDPELFESCYSSDYEGLDKRKQKALRLWKDFDFIHLEYTLKDSIIKEKEGTIRVGWDMKVRSRDTGEIKDLKDDLTVFLIKDGDLWRIRRVIKEKG